MRISLILTIFGILCPIRCFSSFWDNIPVIAQVKSAVQATFGDSEGALKTQEIFSRGLIGGPIRGVVEHVGGNHDAAKETWSHYGKQWEGVADGTPVVAHVKGIVHYATGDSKKGDEVMKSGTRVVGVIAGGVVGGIVGGPPGAVVGGIAGGVAMDGIYTGIDSVTHQEYKPNGIIHSGTLMINGESNPGHVFDTVLGVAADGLGGRMAGKASPKQGSLPGKSAVIAGCRRRKRGLGGVCAGGSTGTNIVGAGVKPPTNPRPPSVSSSFTSSSSGGSRSSIGSGVWSDISSPGLSRSPSTIQLIPPPPKPAVNLMPGHQFPVLVPAGGRPLANPSISSGTGIGAINTVQTAVGNMAVPSVWVGPIHAMNQPQFQQQQQQQDPKCNTQPEIQNRNENQMADCVGTQPNKDCRVRCKAGFDPTKNTVRCIKNGANAAKWELNGATCQPADIVCRDGNNNPVDWFIMYRLPKLGPIKGSHLVQGSSYLLMTSKNQGGTGFDDAWTDWSESGFGAVTNTLAPIRAEGRSTSSLQFAMYSDQPPDGSHVSNTYAHAKGVYASRNGHGFFMPHTLPKYPPKNGHMDTSSNIYGQLFMCISLGSTMEISKVVSHIIHINANVYYRGGSTLVSAIPAMGLRFPQTLQSRYNERFELFGKRAMDVEDIWSFIANRYSKPLLVQNWVRGGGLPSICPGTTNPIFQQPVENIDKIKFARDIQGLDIHSNHRDTQDHAKWGVQKGFSDKVWCFGDLNRMTSQMTRPGGAICFKNNRVAETFREMIVSTECGIYDQLDN